MWVFLYKLGQYAWRYDIEHNNILSNDIDLYFKNMALGAYFRTIL